MVTETASYERLPQETQEAYHAFCVYRDLGPKRSVDAAFNIVRQEYGKPTAKRADQAEAWGALQSHPGATPEQQWWLQRANPVPVAQEGGKR